VLVVALGLLGGLGGGLLTATAARADEGNPGSGLLRVAHLSPDTPAVDVTVGPPGPTGAGTPLPDLSYGEVTGYQELPAGRYAVGVRAAGAGTGGPALLSTLVDVPAGGARTVVVSGRFAALELDVSHDDLSAPPPGAARVRVLAAAASAGPLDVTLAGGPALAEGLHFPEAGGWVEFPAGPVTLHVDDGGATADLPVHPLPGSVSTVLVLDRPGGGLTVQLVTDAAGPARAPVGPVDAGAGGAAGTGTPAAVALVLATAAALRARRARPLLTAVALVAAWLSVPGDPPAGPGPTPTIELATSRAPAGASAPHRVRIPAVGVDAAVVPVALDGTGALAAPAGETTAGWLDSGPAPGAIGPAVITGHVDSRTGPAVFFRLDEVAVGDVVLVSRADGVTAVFAVTRVARYPKAAFPAAEVYAPTTAAELRLITCGGAFDRGARSYTDNVVVFARATG
jgi:hypothetical protein